MQLASPIEATTKILEQLADPTNRNIRVAVVGLGFVGLPLSLSFATRGCTVVGFDISEARIRELRTGTPHDLEEGWGLPLRTILEYQQQAGRFVPSDDPSALDGVHNFILTVGMPVANGVVDHSHIISAAATIGQRLIRGSVVIVRSTVVPGTTQDILLPVLEAHSGLRAGKDFHLAYASERIAEGRAFEEFEKMPLVVGGCSQDCIDAAGRLLAVVTKADIHQASSIKVVEMTKVIENVQRDVNIAMVQQVARVCAALDLYTPEVIKLANTHTRVNLLNPGPGVGGYCIPNAFHYLAPAAAAVGVEVEMLRLARDINDQVPNHVVNLITEQLGDLGKGIEGTKIAVMGLAMKDYSSDDRLSPALRVVELLLEKGARVTAFDPVVATPRPWAVDSLDEALDSADCVVILARQQAAEWKDIVVAVKRCDVQLIVDTRGVVNPSEAREMGIRLVRF